MIRVSALYQKKTCQPICTYYLINMTYYINKKRNFWCVLENPGRKQLAKFDNKTAAKDYVAKLQANAVEQTQPVSEFYFKSEWLAYANQRLADAADHNNRLSIAGVQGYMNDYNQRISKYMPDVLLSNFNILVLEQFLKDAHKAGQKYKTLKRQVRNIKTFLRRMNAVGKKPCLETLDFKVHEFYAIVPADDNKYFEAVPTVISDKQIQAILEKLNSEKLKDEDCAMKFGIFTMSLFFGLRRSELLGLKRSHVDLDNNLLHIIGIRDRNGEWLNRTKNRGSKRSIELDVHSAKFLKYWLDYVNVNYSHSLWLFPSLKKTTYGSLSPKKVSELIWTTYADMGLAKIERRSDGHIKVIESDFKGAPLKTFRHRLATMLINSMNSEKTLDANYIKSVIGHTRFQTTRDRYGNHSLIGSLEERKARTAAKQRALNLDNLIKNS